MRRLLQRLLKKPIIRLSDKYSARPDKARVFSALTSLHNSMLESPGHRGRVIDFSPERQKFVILSDQHKGTRNDADDFAGAESNYLAALTYYNQHQFHYINLGDSEELWENTFAGVKKHNKATFDKERIFLNRNAFTKVFGNHDLYWDNDPMAPLSLQQVYGKKIDVYEGVLLRAIVGDQKLEFFLTHGHQGDRQSDGNWFSKWFVSNIWGPVQGYLRINPNTPANNFELKTAHNEIMYEWSRRQKDLILITGHTHQPVFRSFTHLEKLYADIDKAKMAGDDKLVAQLQLQIDKRHAKGDSVMNFNDYKPCYFNTGCCCFDDGDITGIELESGMIRLVKWKYIRHRLPERTILEECRLEELLPSSETMQMLHKLAG